MVSALPTAGQKEGILYMVPDATDATKFDTFVWEITDDTTTPPTYGWVQQGEGNATVDLSNYYTKTETDTLLAGKASSTHSHGNITNDGKLGTASRAVVTDANGAIDVSSVTATELGYVSGVTSSIQTQLNKQTVQKLKKTKVIREANEHYSLRYTEALIVECKYLRRCIARLTARIEELEKGNNIK